MLWSALVIKTGQDQFYALTIDFHQSFILTFGLDDFLYFRLRGGWSTVMSLWKCVCKMTFRGVGRGVSRGFRKPPKISVKKQNAQCS